jgi:S1-C subfamily serine protease
MQQTPDLPSVRNQDRLRRLRVWLTRGAMFLAGVTAALAALLVFHLAFPPAQPLTENQVNDVVSAAMASATTPPAIAAQVYQEIRPSLVLIQTKSPGTDGKLDDGLGSGVIVNAAGDILTCLHVVNGATEIQVTFADGTQSSAQVTTSQPENDIAVLKADQLPAQVVPAVLGNPKAMHIGDEAYAVGNPFGLYDSMSAGVISGFDREFQSPNNSQPLTGLIQIDTAVNPGNSGGPLLNRAGQVIGIIEGIVNPTGENFFIGIGFAVPINIAGSAAGLPPD